MDSIGAVRFSANGKNIATLYQSGAYETIDWSEESASELSGLTCYTLKQKVTKTNAEELSSLAIVQGLNGSWTLRLRETLSYVLEYGTEPGARSALVAQFQNEGKHLKCDRNRNSVTFQYVNFLGRSRIRFGTEIDAPTLAFEVVPMKMDYEDDYVVLTEELAEKCSALLLDYAGSTSNTYRAADETQKTLLEQFVFLRQFCYGSNIQALFAAIKRNPDRVLDCTEETRPLGLGAPSKQFYTNPFANGCAWAYTGRSNNGGGRYLPQRVNVTRKFDCLDTPANRFVKYALHEFNNVCLSLMTSLETQKGDARQTTCYQEAVTLHEMLDTILSDVFFDNVGTLQLMPQNNQVLQKREGYSQVFAAYSMLDMALQLDWKGMDSAYEGESKNVALLYEYWLFFELFSIIRNIDGCLLTEVNEQSPFISETNDGLTINLKQGKCSCQHFEVSKFDTKIDLYYNRTFKHMEFKAAQYEGSYSTKFRPDYTLAVFPSAYEDEHAALKDGTVAFIHFDAKYRINNQAELFGRETELELEDSAGMATNPPKSSYKNDDLIKMHTYNDAIRRTVGSYVLYPGADATNAKKQFKLFEEILPGVGAFAIKPSTRHSAEKLLGEFIEEAVKMNAEKFTRLNRLNYFTEMVVSEPSSIGKTLTEHPQDITETIMIGYIRGGSQSDYYHFLKNSGRLNCGCTFPFYFYAIKDGYVYSHHKDLFRTAQFRFYKNAISETGTYELEPILCQITSNELTSKSDLAKRLSELGYERNSSSQGADFYYVLNMQVIDDSAEPLSLACSTVDSQNGNDAFSPHSPKLVNLGQSTNSD